VKGGIHELAGQDDSLVLFSLPPRTDAKAMKTLRTIWSRIRSLWRRREVKREIDEELRFHLEQRTAENIANGMTPEEAAREARKRFGNVQSVREECRETKRAGFGEKVWRDVRFGFRMLRKNPGFTTLAVLTLALGIGATTAMFSIVNAVLLRPLPFKDADRLVTVWERNPEQGYEMNGVAPGNFDDWKAQNTSFSGMAEYRDGLPEQDLTVGEETERIAACPVSANLFPLLGVEPMLGRGFADENDIPGSDGAVVLSHDFWRRRFAGDPDVLGKSVRLDGRARTVVGVMPGGFRFPAGTGEASGTRAAPDLWIPAAIAPAQKQNRGTDHSWIVLARLKPGVTLEQARREMDAIQARVHAAFRDYFMGTQCTVVPLREQSAGAARPTLCLLLSVVLFVLLIACVNVANLLLVRLSARQKEFAVRAALGAGRAAVVRQLLCESLLLSGLGGALGVLLAAVGVPLLTGSVGGNVATVTPGWNEIGMDGAALAFTVGVVVLTGVLFGLFPAWTAAKGDVYSSLKDDVRGTTSYQGRRVRGGLVVAEVALAVMLLVGAGLLLRSFSRLQQIHPGFNPVHVLTFRLGLPEVRFPGTRERSLLVNRLCERLQALPGVEFAAATTVLPLADDSIDNRTYRVNGQPPPEPGRFISADFCFVTPDYFRAMQTPLIAGRYLAPGDTAEAPYVCLINETLARRRFPNEDPVGRQITLVACGRIQTIVGVVRDMKHHGLDRSLVHDFYEGYESAIYMPYAQQIYNDETSIVLRAAGDPTALLAALPKAVREVDPLQPVARLRVMEDIVDASLAQPRFRARFVMGFGAAAALLAALGLYGVVAHTAAQRTREMSIRMALGATRWDVRALMLRQGLTLVSIGIAVGVAGAFLLSHLISRMLFGVTANDPLTFVSVPLVLIVVAAAACYVPARRAARANPMEALRGE
jgi:putative ABC transport system permease protein